MAPQSVRFVHPAARPLRVLIADDNREAADTLADLLGLVGCDVEVCYDGGTVLALAEDFRPDVCILDLWMPVLNGWQAAERLRAWADGRSLLLVALSGLSGQEAETRSADSGFDHHITKASHPNAIFARLAAFVVRMEDRLSASA